MPHSRTFVLILASALTGLGTTPAHAQDGPTDPYRDTVTVGIGVAALPDYEGSNDYRISPAPAAIGAVKGYAFVLAGNQLSVDLVKNTPGPVWDIQAGPIAQLNFNRSASSSIEDLRVRALGRRAVAVEIGGYVGLGKTGVLTSPYDTLSVTLGYRHDVSGVHDSAILSPGITYFTPLTRRAAIGLFASADIVERSYAQTYYSVSAAQSVASGLPTYTARGGLKSWTLGAICSYSLTGDLLHGVKLVAVGTYGRLEGSITRSPLVAIAGSRDQWFGTTGLAYTF